MKGRFGRKLPVLFILVGAAGMCLLSWQKIQRAAWDGVYALSFQRNDRIFTETDIANIEKEGIDLTYTLQVYPDVSNGFRREEIPVSLTNENYAFFTNTHMQKGAFFNGMQIDGKLAVTVLNEEAAIQLFGNRECVGETVYLNKVPYEIIGIMAGKDGEEAGIYVPYSTKNFLDIQDLEISQIWCGFPNLADAALVMKKVGYPIEMLEMIQIDLVKGIFLQRFLSLLIITDAYAVFLACRWVWKGRKCLAQIKAFKQNGNTDAKWFGISALQVLGICIGVVLLWKAVELAWCVPPSYELPGGGWKEIFFCIMDFYLLAGAGLDNMPLLSQWNLVSILSAAVYVYCFSLCIFARKPVGMKNLWDLQDRSETQR